MEPDALLAFLLLASATVVLSDSHPRQIEMTSRAKTEAGKLGKRLGDRMKFRQIVRKRWHFQPVEHKLRPAICAEADSGP